MPRGSVFKLSRRGIDLLLGITILGRWPCWPVHVIYGSGMDTCRMDSVSRE